MTKALLDQRELLKSYRSQKPDISRPGAVPREVKCELDFANRLVSLFLYWPCRTYRRFSSFSNGFYILLSHMFANFCTFLQKEIY